MEIFYILAGILILKVLADYIKNERSPIITTKAKILERNSHTQDGGYTSYYWLLELDTRYIFKLQVNKKIYSKAPVNEWGTLKYQGTRFLEYECSGRTYER